MILVGAGISRSPPSLLPLATELHDAIIRAVFGQHGGPSTKGRLRHLAALRPEVVLGVLYRVLGMYALDVLDCLEGRPPNVIHHLLASSLAYNNTVCTTNFDNLIEEACRSSLIPFTLCADDAAVPRSGAAQQVLFKIHGTLRDASGQSRKDTIVATLDQVGQGLSAPKTTLLRRLVQARPLLVLGYSGLDEFDIVPCLRQARTAQPVYWVAHAAAARPVIATARQLKRKGHPDALDALLLSCFRRSVRIDVDTVRLATDLLRHVGIIPAMHAATPTAHVASIMQWGARLSHYDRLRAQGRLLEETGGFRDAMRVYGRALAIARRSGDRSRECVSLDDIAFLHGAQGRYRAARAAYRRMEQQAQNDIDRGRALFGQAKTSRALGEPQTAVRDLEAARRLFAGAGRTDLATSLLHDMGQSYLLLGEYERARSLFRRREQFFQQRGELEKVAWSRTGQATALYLLGHFRAAQRLLEQTTRKFGHVLGAFDRAWAVTYLGDARRMCGDLAGAERAYAEAAAVFQRTSEQGGLASVDLGRAEIERARGRNQAAQRLYRKHVKYLGRAGRRLLLAHALLGLAECARVAGRRRPDYERALRLYRRMGVPWGIVFARIGHYCYLESRGNPRAARIATEIARLIRTHQLQQEQTAWQAARKTGRVVLNFP
jgi:tetratricopeptide (TPR) repeat protein